MNRTVERGFSILGASLALSLGATACGSQQHESTSTTKTIPCKTIDGATNIKVIGVDKVGTWNTENSGECVGIYSPKTLRSVGTLAHHDTFVIDCLDGLKPAAFNIETAKGSVKGDINLAPNVIDELQGKDYFKGVEFQDVHIPAC